MALAKERNFNFNKRDNYIETYGPQKKLFGQGHFAPSGVDKSIKLTENQSKDREFIPESIYNQTSKPSQSTIFLMKNAHRNFSSLERAGNSKST